MNYAVATPEQRQAAEDRVNRDLRSGSWTIPRRVCMHPNRTARSVYDGTLIECDYCPAYAVSRPGDMWPDIEPEYYEDLPDL